MNTPLSDLLPDVMPLLYARPADAVAITELRKAAIELCAESGVWQMTTDPITLLPGESVIDIDVPNDADVSAVLDARLHGKPLDKKPAQWLNVNMPGWRTEAAVPRFFTQLEVDQVILAPAPATRERQALVLTVALQPARAAEDIPRWLARRYHDALVDGAVARLMLMPNKLWTDMKSGQMRRELFSTAKVGAHADAETAMGSAPIRTTSYH